jgi:hypothetical protein
MFIECFTKAGRIQFKQKKCIYNLLVKPPWIHEDAISRMAVHLRMKANTHELTILKPSFIKQNHNFKPQKHKKRAIWLILPTHCMAEDLIKISGFPKKFNHAIHLRYLSHHWTILRSIVAGQRKLKLRKYSFISYLHHLIYAKRFV